VPGHGAAGPATMIDEVDRYLVQLDDTVRAAMRQGVSLAAAPEATALPGYAGWDQYDTLHRRNVDTLYLLLEKAATEAASAAPAVSPQ